MESNPGEAFTKPQTADSPDRASRVIARCLLLAKISDVPGQTTRLFLSHATRQVHAQLHEWVCSAGLDVRMDDAGNLRGLLRSHRSDAPAVLLFSHIDTVPDAGAFDGILGVVLALEILECMSSRQLPFDVEIIALSEEEGIRFSYPFFSSQTLVRQIGPSELSRADDAGLTFADAIRSYGLDPGRILDSCPISSSVIAALEVHIEQGPVLQGLNLPLGIVETIVGQSRFTVTFQGQANHAGTTPMFSRRDALAAAAEWITSVEDYARNCEGLVATVGQITVQPNSVNVIPSTVVCRLDVRHRDDQVRLAALGDICRLADLCGDARRVAAYSNLESERSAVPMNRNLTILLAAAIERGGYRAPLVASGAGHDAMILAPHVPTAMLFVRSPHGLSHHPGETVRESDVSAALIATGNFLDQLAAHLDSIPPDQCPGF